MSGVLSNDAYKRTFNYPSSPSQGAIVASMPAGSFFGALAVSKLADVIGRKWTIIISGWIWVIGSILQCAAVVSALSSCPAPVFLGPRVERVCALRGSRSFRARTPAGLGPPSPEESARSVYIGPIDLPHRRHSLLAAVPPRFEC